MLMNRRTCPLSSRKCCVIAGCFVPRLSSNPVKFAPSHSILPPPSVNRRSALGISTVTFIVPFLIIESGCPVLVAEATEPARSEVEAAGFTPTPPPPPPNKPQTPPASVRLQHRRTPRQPEHPESSSHCR